jgi:autotransporter-associated beta strand protein
MLSAISTSQGIWATGASGGVTTTISGAFPLTITGTATLDSVANAGILLDGAGNNNLTLDSSVTNLTNTNTTSYLVNNGGTLQIDSGLTIGAGKTLTLGGTGSAGAITVNGNIASSTGVLVLDAAGTITLNGTSANTGGTYVGVKNSNAANGTVVISNNAALGAGTITLVSGYQTSALVTLEASNDLTGANAIANTVSYAYGSSSNPSRMVSVGGSHSIEFSGAASGTTNVSFFNNIASGKALTFSGTLGLPSGATNFLTFFGSGDTIISGTVSTVGGNISFNATGTLTISNNNNTYSGNTYVGPANSTTPGYGTVIVGSDGALGASTLNLFSGNTAAGPYVTFEASTDVTLANDIVLGNGSGTKKQASVVGGTHSITVNGSAVMGVSTTVLNNMTNGAVFTIGAADGLRLPAFVNATFDGPGKTVISNGISSGTSGVTYKGSGTLAIGGVSTFTGGLVITSGTVQTTSVGALDFGGAVAKTPGATSVSGGGTLDIGGQSLTESITLNGGNLANSGSAATLTNGVKGLGVSTTSAAFSGSEALTVNFAGGGGTGAAANGLLGVNTSTFSITDGGSGYGVSKSNLAVVTISGGGGTGATATANTDATGAITSITITNAGVGYTSAPTITFNAPASGATATGAGNDSFSLVAIQQTDAGSGYITAPTATVTASTGTATLTSVAIAAIKLTGTANTIGGTGDITINSIVSGTNGGFTKTGANVVTLNGANTYTGGTTISDGTLVAGSTKALGSGDVTVDGGTLELDPPVNIGAGDFNLASGVLNLDLGLDPTNGITGTGTYNLGDSTTVDLGIGAAAFDYGATYNILAFTSGTVGNISITDYDTSNFTASITDSGGTAVLSFTESGTAVPEPASLSILALGAAALLTRRKR